MTTICVIITARPSYARIKSILSAIENSDRFRLQLVVCASALLDRYGSAIDIIEADGFCIDRTLYSVVEGENRETSVLGTGLLCTQLASTLAELRPDAALVIADRHEVLAAAIAASYQHIPLIHLQGGERTGSIDDKVRYAITALSDYHGVATRVAWDRVVAAGMAPSRVKQIGCPSLDLCRTARPLDRPIEPIIVFQHPVTNESVESAQQMEVTLEAIEQLNLQYLVLWPGHDAGTADMAEVIRQHRAGRHLRNVPPEQFYRYLLSIRCLVGNSSVGIRECSFLGVPVVNIGTRQQGRERGPNVIDVGYNLDDIKRAVKTQVEGDSWRYKYAPFHLYGDGFAAERFMRWMDEVL